MENQVTNNNDEIEIDLGEIFHLILSRLGVIILSGIILGVISIIGTMLFITPQYESTTKIMVAVHHLYSADYAYAADPDVWRGMMHVMGGLEGWRTTSFYKSIRTTMWP